MPDEASENIGGISVSVGATHARLTADLAEANRILDQWAAQRFNVQVGAIQQQATAVRQAAQATAISVGPGTRTQVQAQQAQTALQRAINSELGKTGERYNAQTGEIEKATAATQKQRTAVLAVQQEAAKPTALEFDTGAAQRNLDAILATLQAITTEAGALGRVALATPTRPGTGAPAAAETTPSTAVSPQLQRDVLLLQQRVLRRQVTGSSGGLNSVDERRLRELTYQAEQRATGANIGGTFAPQRTPAQRAAYVAQEAARANAQAGQPPTAQAARANVSVVQRASQEERNVRRAIQAEQRRDEEVFNRASVTGAQDRERQIEEQIARRRANITAAGRTSRTEASGLAALFGGTQGRLIEANARLGAATRTRTEAEKAALPFQRRIAEYDLDIAASSGKVAAARTKARDAFIADPKTQAALENETKAIKGQATALADLNKLQGPTSIIRNLAAITAGGAAFGLGLKAIDFGISALGDAFSNLLDIQTGFGITSQRVTTQLGTQTLTLHGNAQAAIATAAAQSNLSDASAAYLETVLKLPTQIKAGAQAQQTASDLFRAVAGPGGAPQGLFGGYGGIGGGALFGQQLGGGRGFTETIGQDLGKLAGPARRPFDIGQVPGGLGDFFSSLNPLGQNFAQGGYRNAQGQVYNQPAQAPSVAAGTQLSTTTKQYLDDLNKAAERGGPAIGSLSKVTYELAATSDEAARAANLAAAAGDDYGASLARNTGIVVKVNGQLAQSVQDYQQAVEQVVAGRGIADIATLRRAAVAQQAEQFREFPVQAEIARRQQQFEFSQPAVDLQLELLRNQQARARPGIVAGIGRQQQLAANVTLPAQQALANLQNPLQPTTTGLVAANAAEQAKINAGLKQANDLQSQLNAGYAQGRQILEDTYKPAIVANFGQAAGRAFDTALSAVESTGKQIASIQAGISNEQAAYQTAQYNFQLLIAKRNLSDIGGLVGKNFGAGESFLGVLERQNLALSRQGQLLQFALSQRQINFQVAQAGFQAPGVTAEERAANVAEAKLEASYAQKQLDIQKQTFQNQVKIVDIGNLRQGYDLAHQIGLLLQGRAVTIDTALAEKKLQRLSLLQQQQVAKVSTYVAAVDSLAQSALGEMAALEAAAGHALEQAGVDAIKMIYGFYTGLTNLFSGGGGGAGGTPSTQPGQVGYTPGGHATGGVYNTLAPTRIGSGIMGEASGETVAILAHPRAFGMAGESGGNSTFNVNFYGDIHTSNTGDLAKIARAVEDAINAKAARIGLRSMASSIG